MGKGVKICLLVLLVLSISGEAMAASDFQYWPYAGLRYRITRKFDFHFTQRLKFTENASKIGQISPDLKVTYRALRFFRVALGYRFLAEPEERDGGTYWDNTQRIYGDLLFRYNKRPLRLRYRIRYQQGFTHRENKNDTWRYTQTLRNKAEIGFNLGKGFVPYVSGEVFMRFKDPDGILHKWRATTGLGYRYKSHEFNLYIRGEGFLNNQNLTRVILGSGYRYVF